MKTFFLNAFLVSARFIEARATDVYLYALNLALARAVENDKQIALQAEIAAEQAEAAAFALKEAKLAATEAKGLIAPSKTLLKNTTTAINAEADRVRSGAVVA